MVIGVGVALRISCVVGSPMIVGVVGCLMVVGVGVDNGGLAGKGVVDSA